MFEGDMEEGELEIGQIAGNIHAIDSVQDIVNSILKDFHHTQKEMSGKLF